MKNKMAAMTSRCVFPLETFLDVRHCSACILWNIYTEVSLCCNFFHWQRCLGAVKCNS